MISDRKKVTNMITTKRDVEHFVKRCGGEGTMHIEHLLPPEILKDQIKMYAKVTIDVNSSLGVHQHTDDGECYYILQGKAKYNDNGKEVLLTKGACTFTPAGFSHGIENIGDEPLIFMALILKA